MDDDIKIISAEELYELMFTGKDLAGHDMILINVLDQECFNDCHIHGSIHIDCENLETHVNDWDRARVIIVYCASSTCPINAVAYQTFVDMGFTNVRSYEGGMKEWNGLGYPSRGPCALDYLAHDLAPRTDRCLNCKESISGCICE